VTIHFFRRHALSAWITLATIIILRMYKIVRIGR
jgi:hypothetical protein